MLQLGYISLEMSKEFDESVRLGAEKGVKSLALRSKVMGKNLEDLTDEEINDVKGILAQNGSRASAVYSSLGKCAIDDDEVREKNLSDFQRNIELAKTFGTKLIRVFPFQRKGYEEYEPSRLDQYVDRIAEVWSPLIKEAESQDVVLCFECVGSTIPRTSSELRKVLDAIGPSPAAGAIWEIDVAFRDGEVPSQGYPHLKGLIHDVHIKPHPELPLSGAGESYEQAFKRLVQDGYNGPVTIEHWKTTEAELQALEDLKPIIAGLS